jgi:hypothetical protein
MRAGHPARPFVLRALATSADRSNVLNLARPIGLVGLVIALLAFAGLVLDLFVGLPFTRSAPTWPSWLGGLLLGGLVYALAGIGFDRITADDRTTDPLATRLLRLVLGMSFMAAFMAVVLFLVRMFSR